MATAKHLRPASLLSAIAAMASSLAWPEAWLPYALLKSVRAELAAKVAAAPPVATSIAGPCGRLARR